MNLSRNSGVNNRLADNQILSMLIILCIKIDRSLFSDKNKNLQFFTYENVYISLLN